MAGTGVWRVEQHQRQEQTALGREHEVLDINVELFTSYQGTGIEPDGLDNDSSIRNIDNLSDIGNHREIHFQDAVSGDDENSSSEGNRASVIGRGYSLESIIQKKRVQKCRMFGEFWIDSNEQPANGSEDFEEDLRNFQRYNTDLFSRFVPFRLLRRYIDSIEEIGDLDGDIEFPNPDKFTGALLFADISQFSKLTRSYVRDYDKRAESVNTRSFAAETLWKYLNNNVFREITTIINKNGGDILKFVGDGIMAAFPLDVFDDDKAEAVSACIQVALEILQIDTSNVHCGIGFGEISCYVVGGIENRVEYFVSGNSLAQAINTEKASSIIYKENQRRHGMQRIDENKVEKMPIGISMEAMNCLGRRRSSGFRPFRGRAYGLKDCYYIKKPKNRTFKEVNPEDYVGKLKREYRAMQELKEDVRNKLNENQKLILKTICSLHGPKTIQTYLKLAGSEKLSPELRVCTSMFIKLDGIQDGQALDSHEIEIIQAAVSEVQIAVSRYGGIFLRFVVDDKGAILFVAFGLPPRRFDEDNVRAVVCALEIHERIQNLRAEIQSNNDSGLAKILGVSIGITSGKVFCGIVGDQYRCEYTIHGESVNFANNLMAHASTRISEKHDVVKILVGAEVKDQVESILQIGPTIKLKDHIREDTNGEGTAHTIIGRKLRNMKKFYMEEFYGARGGVNRMQKEQLVTLREKKLLVVKGEYGMGKSHLTHTLAQSLSSEENTDVIVTQGGWFDRYSEYHVLKHVLLQLCTKILKRADGVGRPVPWPENEAVAREQLKRLLTGTNEPELIAILDIFFDRSLSFQRQNGPKGFAMMTDALGKCIDSFFKAHPKQSLIILVDDWHMVHKQTRKLLWNLYKRFNEAASKHHLTLLVTSNEDLEDEVCKHALTHGCRYELNPMNRNEVTEMIQYEYPEMGGKSIKYLQTVGCGNPRHIKEVLHILVDMNWFVDLHQCKLTADAWGMISDMEVQYSDYVTRTITNAQKHRKSYVEKRNSSMHRPATVTSFFSVAGGLSANPTEQLDIKINEYYDSHIYPTTSILSSQLDRLSPMQHMTLKIAATIGTSFSSDLLLNILCRLDDNVHALFESSSILEAFEIGPIRAAVGPIALLREFLDHSLESFIYRGILERQGGSDVYKFGSILMRETAHQMLPHHLRVYVHWFAAAEAGSKTRDVALFETEVEYEKFVAYHSYELSKFLLHQCYDFSELEDIFELGYRNLKKLEARTVRNGLSRYLFFSLSRLTEWETRFAILDHVHTSQQGNSKMFHDWYERTCSLEDRAVTCRRMAQYEILHSRTSAKALLYLNDSLDLLGRRRIQMRTSRLWERSKSRFMIDENINELLRVEVEYLLSYALLLNYQSSFPKVGTNFTLLRSRRIRTLEQWRSDTRESRDILDRAYRDRERKLTPEQVATYAYSIAVIDWRTLVKNGNKLRTAIQTVQTMLSSINVEVEQERGSEDLPYLLHMMAKAAYMSAKATYESYKRARTRRNREALAREHASRVIANGNTNTFPIYIKLWLEDETQREYWLQFKQRFLKMLGSLDFPRAVVKHYASTVFRNAEIEQIGKTEKLWLQDLRELVESDTL